MRQRAFTLIELLVVIATIAILMAILMPALNLARDQATRVHCVSNVKTLALGWLMYKDDFDGKIVPGHTGTRSHGGRDWSNQLQWVEQPGDLDASWEIKKDRIAEGLLFKYVGEQVDIYRCPADRRRESWSLPVAFRTFSIAGGANGEPWGAYDAATIYTEIEQPATKYVFVEEMDTRGCNIGSWQMNPVGKSWTDPLAMWHNNKSTLGFADGHAEMHTWKSKSFIDWCTTAMEDPHQFSFGLTPPGDDLEDVEYMAKGFPRRISD